MGEQKTNQKRAKMSKKTTSCIRPVIASGPSILTVTLVDIKNPTVQGLDNRWSKREYTSGVSGIHPEYKTITRGFGCTEHLGDTMDTCQDNKGFKGGKSRQ